MLCTSAARKGLIIDESEGLFLDISYSSGSLLKPVLIVSILLAL